MPHRLTRAGAILIATVAQLTTALAQDYKSRLVLFFPDAIPKEVSVEVNDVDGKLVNSSKWYSSLPFYREFILPKAEYKIFIPEPISSITLSTDGKTKTFLQIARYSVEKGEQGVQITSWRGAPNSALEKAISEYTKAGIKDILEPVQLENIGNVIQVNTEPPWPLPFPPTPLPVPPPK